MRHAGKYFNGLLSWKERWSPSVSLCRLEIPSAWSDGSFFPHVNLRGARSRSPLRQTDMRISMTMRAGANGPVSASITHARPPADGDRQNVLAA